jgi:hypothetical protein
MDDHQNEAQLMSAVWRPRNTTFQQEHIVGTTAFGGGGFTVWGCFSLNCKIDLYVIDWPLRGQKYRASALSSTT